MRRADCCKIGADRLKAALRVALEQEGRVTSSTKSGTPPDHVPPTPSIICVGKRMPACNLAEPSSADLRAVQRRERNDAMVRAAWPRADGTPAAPSR